MKRRLDYVCMQPMSEGQASFAHVNEIVAGLRRRGWDVRLVEPGHPRPGRADGLRRAFVAATAQVRYLLDRRFRPAPFVYIRSHFLTLPTAIIARMAGSVVVQEVNGASSDAYDAWPALRPFHRILTIVVDTQIRMADAVVVVTPGLESHVRDHSGRLDGYHVIGNGADVERFRPEAAVAGRPRYVAFIGALASWQGIDTVLEALTSPDWPAGIDVVIAGDGKERGRIEAAAELDPRIRYLGTVKYEQIPGLLAGSLAALVPKADSTASQFGLSPLKLFEGMAAGVPVIVSDLAGLSEVVRSDRCGLVFPAGDGPALALAVAELAADPERAAGMGARAREAAVTRYSWDARAGQTEDVLLGLAAKAAVTSPSTMQGA